jgi:MFS family permease
MKKLFRNPNLLVIFSVTMISIMGVASLTPAFPGIAKAFNISAREVVMLVTIFTLPGVFLTPVFGVLADRYGRKMVLVPSLILFGIAGTLCFFIHDFDTLVILRFFQGVGAASLGSINATLIGDIFEGKERGMAMGLNASVISVGTAAFPIIGGVLATFSWYYPFLLPSLAFVVGILVLSVLKAPKIVNDSTIKEYFKKTIKFLLDKNLIKFFILSTFTFIILYGPYLSYLPFIVEDTFLKEPYVVGIIMSFASLASFITSIKVGKFLSVSKDAPRKLIMLSTIFYFLSMLMVPFIDYVWLLIIPSILFGVGQGINLPSIQYALTSLAPMEQRGAIMSVNGTVFRLGQTIGPLIVIPVYAIWNINGAFSVGAGIAILMLFVAWTIKISKND